MTENTEKDLMDRPTSAHRDSYGRNSWLSCKAPTMKHRRAQQDCFSITNRPPIDVSQADARRKTKWLTTRAK
jgi:hypothetical protein